jgi:hypothetical protein
MIVFDVFCFLATGESIARFAINAFAGQQFDNPPRLLAAILYNISLPIVSLGLIGGLYLLLKKNRAGLFFLLSAILPVVLLVLLNPIMFTKDRYVFMTLPSRLILVAGTGLITRDYWRAGFGALLEVGLEATFVSVFARVFGAVLRTGLAEVFRVVLESLLPFKRATTSGVR